VREFLKEHTEMAEEIEGKVRTALGVGDKADEVDTPAEKAIKDVEV